MLRRSGFTLVELLVVLGVIATLAALLFPTLSAARKKADAAESVSNLRQIGIAINLHTGDHGGRLPGPLWPGQVALYDIAREGRLVRELATYLEIPPYASPTLVEWLVTPGYRRATPGADWTQARIYVMHTAVDTGGGTIEPWGSLTGSEPKAALSVHVVDRPGSTWAIAEADRKHPAVSSAPWAANTPAAPLLGNRRTVLYFDWHAALEKTEP